MRLRQTMKKIEVNVAYRCFIREYDGDRLSFSTLGKTTFVDLKIRFFFE